MSTPSPAETLAADLAHWRGWIGRSERRHDLVTAAPLAALAATLDRDDPEPMPGSDVPPMAHWLYFLPLARQGELGPDGHPRRGGFLPPVPLPRRMWAGGRFSFQRPLRVGDDVERTSTIDDVKLKTGRTGPLAFVTVRHDMCRRGEVEPAVTEFHDIVYREARQPGDAEPPPVAAPTGADWQRTVVPDDVLLFRFSALTFNGHRIHYDRRYVTEVEGYPGLIVHGPMIAALLLDLLHEHLPDADVAAFRFKAVRPTFDLHPFRLNGRREGDTVRLWAHDHEGWLTMDAVATLRS